MFGSPEWLTPGLAERGARVGSQAGTGETGTPPKDWATTGVIIGGAMAAAFGIVLGLLWLGIIGGVLMAVGGGYALLGGMLDRVEEYDMPRKDVH